MSDCKTTVTLRRTIVYGMRTSRQEPSARECALITMRALHSAHCLFINCSAGRHLSSLPLPPPPGPRLPPHSAHHTYIIIFIPNRQIPLYSYVASRALLVTPEHPTYSPVYMMYSYFIYWNRKRLISGDFEWEML